MDTNRIKTPELVKQAIKMIGDGRVSQADAASILFWQRRLGLNYSNASRLVDALNKGTPNA